MCLFVQLLLPGFIGMANNGDFGKVYGWLCLAPRGGEQGFVYFQPEYLWRARNYWNSPYHSSESALAWLATRFAGATHEGATFDIRWLGVIHLVLFLAAFGILLAGLRGLLRNRTRLAQVMAGVIPLVAFTDVIYVANLNSFFMDAATLCGLLLMVAAAVWMAASPGPRTGPFCIFTLSALLFVTSKTQHAVWMGLPAALLVAWGTQWTSRKWRIAAWSAAGLTVLAGAAMVVSTDPGYRGQAMFNVLFYGLGPAGADLRSVGVKPEELRYIGMHSYVPGAPTVDAAWTEEFGRRTGFGRLLRWYAQHPGAALGYLAATLKEGGDMRANNIGNFQVAAGRTPGARSERFAMWSTWRGELLRRWPWHIVLWYAVFVAGCLVYSSSLKPIALGIAVFGAGECLAAALLDSLDPARHLLLFQAATDLTICFAAGWLVQQWPGSRKHDTPEAVGAEHGEARGPETGQARRVPQ